MRNLLWDMNIQCDHVILTVSCGVWKEDAYLAPVVRRVDSAIHWITQLVLLVFIRWIALSTFWTTEACTIVDVDIPGDSGVHEKEQEKIDWKYQDLKIENCQIMRIKKSGRHPSCCRCSWLTVKTIREVDRRPWYRRWNSIPTKDNLIWNG